MDEAPFFSLGATRSPQIPPHYIAHWPFQSFNPKLDTEQKRGSAILQQKILYIDLAKKNMFCNNKSPKVGK